MWPQCRGVVTCHWPRGCAEATKIHSSCIAEHSKCMSMSFCLFGKFFSHFKHYQMVPPPPGPPLWPVIPIITPITIARTSIDCQGACIAASLSSPKSRSITSKRTQALGHSQAVNFKAKPGESSGFIVDRLTSCHADFSPSRCGCKHGCTEEGGLKRNRNSK